METIFINGTVGVGKSTMVERLGSLLVVHNICHAQIDLDAIRQFWPAPEHDVFNLELELTNLKSMAVNYKKAGARYIVIAGVIENSDALARYRLALDDDPFWVYRLTALPETIRKRIEGRHHNDPEGLAWHLRRSVELENILSTAGVDHAVFSNDSADPLRAIWDSVDPTRSAGLA